MAVGRSDLPIPPTHHWTCPLPATNATCTPARRPQAPGAFGHFAFIRKPASDLGWDWGPALAPAGVHGDVLLVSYCQPYVAGARATTCAQRRSPDIQNDVPGAPTWDHTDALNQAADNGNAACVTPSGLHVVEQRHPPRQPPSQRQPPQPDVRTNSGGEAHIGQGSHGPTGAAGTIRPAAGGATGIGGAGGSSPDTAAPAILLRLEAEVWVPPAEPPSSTARGQQGGPDQGTAGRGVPECDEASVGCDPKDVVGYVMVELWPSGAVRPPGEAGDGQGREGQGFGAGGGATASGMGGGDGGKRGMEGVPLARAERPVGRQELQRGGQHFVELKVLSGDQMA